MSIEEARHLSDRSVRPSTLQFFHKFRQWCSCRQFDLTPRVTFFACVGLALLYTSAYFLPPVSATGAYFLQSQDFFHLVVVPSLIAAILVSCVIFSVAIFVRRWLSPVVATGSAVLFLCVMTLISIKVLFLAAGYDWRNLIWRGPDLLDSERHIKAGIYIALVAFFWFSERYIRVLVRVLSSIGFAVTALAILRLAMLSSVAEAGEPATPIQVNQAEHSKRVVWIILDELDSAQVFGDSHTLNPKYTNFNNLASVSVFAPNANSPASATVYSIPALLTGIPIGGNGIKISEKGALSLETQNRNFVAFNHGATIFGSLSAAGRTASIMGFYHPYCTLFRVARCDSFRYPPIGGLYSALVTNVPDVILSLLPSADNWADITRDSLDLLPSYVARDDALTFLHLNFPHLPATYADKVLNLAPSSAPLEEYSHNLQLADSVLGEIIRGLEQQLPNHELLLVVSTDHWLRNRWYQADVAEISRPVPLFMWKVGDSQGFRISRQISTVHTVEVIRDYLDGKLSTQKEIADWWNHQRIEPSFVAPHT